jgi:thioredoxin 1
MQSFRLLALSTALVVASSVAPAAPKEIYPTPDRAHSDLKAAIRTAAATHKRVLLDFGGNWCGDCHVLDIYMNDPTNLPILQANFVVVHINVGRMDQNVDLAERYQVPLRRGVPALAILSSQGKLLYSQKNGEFESMHNLQSDDVTHFLAKWKPVKPGCSAVELTC